MSESFPFLAIAKQFDVDYGDVLVLAEYYAFTRRHPPPWAPGIEAAGRMRVILDPRDQWESFYTKLARLIVKHRGVK